MKWCHRCDGRGYIWITPVDGKISRTEKCPRCKGTGREPQSQQSPQQEK